MKKIIIYILLVLIATGCISTKEINSEPRYKIGLIDLMLLKRQKLGAIPLAAELNADGLEVDMGGLGNRATFFILPQNVEHSYGSSDNNPWSIYWLHFGGPSLAAFNEQMAVQAHFHPTHIKDNGEIVALFQKMFKSLELGYSIDNLLFANLGLAHFLSLFIYNTRHFPMPENKNLDSVDKAILFMQERITEVITLKELSSYSNYSVSRFSNLFKQKTGYAPMDYFMQMKIQQACQLLDFNDRSIKDIAITMGFDDPYYFSIRFKQVIGLPPQRYRAVNKD